MENTLKAVLDRARQAELRTIRTEVTALGNAFLIKATIQLANQEFSAHAVVETPLDLIRAEEEAIVRACQFAGIDVGGRAPLSVVPSPVPAVAPARALFNNSGPLYPESALEELSETFEEEPPIEAIDRDALMAESLSLMETIGMDPKAGRTYLQQTYNKRSRIDLTDDELQSFIDYLRAQNHTALNSKLPF